MRLNYGAAWYIGIASNQWSCSSKIFNVVASAQAYFLDLYAGGLTTSAGPHDRWLGFPIRCLAY